MITIQKAFANLTSEEYKMLLDAPVWLALLAAYASDGRLNDAEREDAIKLAHLRRFTAPKSIREIYEEISHNFPKRIKQLNDRLPAATPDKLIYLRAQVKAAHKVLAKLDPDIRETLEENLESFYRHVFNCDNSFFHYFALPVFANKLEKHKGSKPKFTAV